MLGKITKRTVEALEPNSLLWDTGLMGFGARRQSGSGVYYVLRYRWNGGQRIDSIGRHGSPWTAEAARSEALRQLGLVASGTDPRGHQQTGELFVERVERYLAHCAVRLRPKTLREITRHLRRHAAPLHQRELAEIDRRTVATLLGEIEAGSGAVSRNRVRTTLSAFWSWAIAEGLAETNPVTGTNTAPEQARDRVLTPAELGALWRCLGNAAHDDIVRLLILTGQRREEIGGLRWSEVVSDMIVLGSPWTAEAARSEALRQLGLVASGTDPRGHQQTGELFVERLLDAY